MSESILDHGYIPEEHAPDPVIGHGDPTAPGKIGIWLFLASEVMFFIGILGSYIILRSSAPTMFAEHAEALSKKLAGLNTLVLILSSLTMALAVDASQKGKQHRTSACLFLTLLCACGFMVIKTIEYTDKAHHHSLTAAARDISTPLRITSVPSGGTLYAMVAAPGGSTFNGAGFSKLTQKDWARGVIPLTAGADGSYTGEVPGGASGVIGASPIKIFQQAGEQPGPKDKPLTLPADSIHWNGGMYAYDGHIHAHGDGYHFTGWRMPMDANPDFNLNLLSEASIRNSGQGEEVKDLEIDKKDITNDIVYGPWKNIFYASYFALTGVHGLHVVGGIIAISLLLIQSLRGKLFAAQTEYTGLYWHFVDLVWIFLFPLLYLI